MNIYLVDDNITFRNALKFFLERSLNHTVIGENEDGEGFLLSDWQIADIVLMDINMPKTNGIKATKHGTQNFRYAKIIAVSLFKDKYTIEELIKAGFKGFVCKNEVYVELEKAILKVNNGSYYFPKYLHTS